MNALAFTLLSDGSSDRVLLRHLNWLLTQHVSLDISLREQWADLRGLDEKPRGLSARIDTALELYPCDILFVHRDAEAATYQDRRFEIDEAVASLNSTPAASIVPVIPVRMQETWLLFDEYAIRAAAGNPNGTVPLDLPAINGLENERDSKSQLHDCLKLASELHGRRLKKFRERRAAVRVADYIDDFSALRQLSSFEQLELELCTSLREIGAV